MNPNMITCFSNGSSNVRVKPDFLLYKDEKIVNVVDAKWKLLDDKNLYGLAAQNFWQLFSYMNLVSDKEINGYFISPKNTNNIDDAVIFSPKKEGNKSITILSIDFSLDFEDLIEKYRFELVENTLKIKNLEKEKIEIEEVVENITDAKKNKTV